MMRLTFHGLMHANRDRTVLVDSSRVTWEWDGSSWQDLWIWNGAHWQQQTPVDYGLTPTGAVSMVYNKNQDHILAYDG